MTVRELIQQLLRTTEKMDLDMELEIEVEGQRHEVFHVAYASIPQVVIVIARRV